MNKWGIMVKCHSCVKLILTAYFRGKIVSQYAQWERWRTDVDVGHELSVNEGKRVQFILSAGGYSLCLRLRVRIHISPLMSLFFKANFRFRLCLDCLFFLTAQLVWICNSDTFDFYLIFQKSNCLWEEQDWCFPHQNTQRGAYKEAEVFNSI